METSSDSRAALPRLSLCMIVRDAEESLPAALRSARPYMDELIVVDTGSVDDTRRVARELGASVSEFPWCDDFSAARNFSLDAATGDWVFWMDADDVLPPESGAELRRLIAAHPDRDAAFWVMVQQESVHESGRRQTTQHGHLKLFPRHPEIRFRYRVHEQVAPAIRKLGLLFKPSQAIVQHINADRSPDGNAHRSERNLRLLELDLQDHPDDPAVLMNLGFVYLHLPGGAARAIEYAQQSLPHLNPGSPVQTNAFLLLASAYRRNLDRPAELNACLEAHQFSPDDASVLLRLGQLFEELSDLAQAAQYYERLLKSGKLHLSVFHVPDIHARCAVALGRVYLKTGRRPRAEALWRDFAIRYPKHQPLRDELERSLVASISHSTG